VRLLNNPHYAASCTFTTWSRPRFLLLAIVHQVISQKINNKNTGGPIYSLWSSSTVLRSWMCIISSKSQRNTRRAPYHQRKETKESIYNLLSSYDDHHHNIWTSQERRSKTIIPDPHMYIIPEWKKTEKENVAFDDDMVEYIWINHRVDMALLTKWHQQKTFFYSCCSMNCIHTKKRTKGTTLLSLIEPFQPIAVRVVACCCCRATTFSRFFFKCSRSSMAIYSFLSEPVTYFPPFYYHGTRFDAFWLDWNNTERKRGETRKKS
jgi:hypothetical protein